MCGILGACINKNLDLDQDLFRTMLDDMSHRGPDDSGIDIIRTPSHKIALGHRRLSIIDLSKNGHQPMSIDNDRFTVTYNGEIYNYIELRKELEGKGFRFLSDSDTEVLLNAWKAWGEACISKFEGMFSFAIFDKKLQKLILVRDGFGIKPLFYHLSPSKGLYFSSEIPSLLSISDASKQINHRRAYRYLTYNIYDDDEETFFQEIKTISPGHLVIFDLSNSSLEKKRWWNPSLELTSQIPFEEAIENVREKFIHNVKIHLRSDVPVGAALSGGIDSSAIVCVMRHLEPEMPIHTFSFISQDQSDSEEYWVDLVNSNINAIPHKIAMTGSDLISDIEDMIVSQGEPFGGTSIYAQYKIFKAAKDEGIIVTLDGQGADELFAGYNGFPYSVMKSLIEQRSYLRLLSFLRNWSKWPDRNASYLMQSLLDIYTPAKFRNLGYKLIGRNTNPPWIRDDFLREQGVDIASPQRNESDENKGRRLMETLKSQITGRGLPALLRHGDRNSMRWSIESRVPFLTKSFAEYLFSLPEEYFVTEQGETKKILRESMRGIVPNQILDRRDKIGFRTPEIWLREQKEMVYKYTESLEEIDFLDADECRSEIKRSLEDNSGSTGNTWLLLNLSKWVETFS